MEKHFAMMRKTRSFLLSIINELSLEELNTVPPGFANNIIWNFGHLVAAQQGVCYKRSGQPMLISDSLYNRYRPESKPEDKVEEVELQDLKNLLLSTIDSLEADYQSGKFTGYGPWTTRYGVPINNIEDAIGFLSYHDGLHTGYVMALRRCVRQLASNPA